MKTEKILIGEIAMNDDRAEGGKGDIESLARNMDKYGQINAVTVVEDISNSYRYRIIAGRRRIAAAESLGWAEIRADVYEADEISEGSEEMIALSENAAARKRLPNFRLRTRTDETSPRKAAVMWGFL